MLYLVGGCSRSGKTTLARHALERRGIAHLSTDHIARGLYVGKLGGIDPEEDDRRTAAKMEPLLFGTLMAIGFEESDYLVEGVHVTPRLIQLARTQIHAPIRGVLLGYPDADLEAKLEALAARPPRRDGRPDWLFEFDRDAQLRFLENQREISRDHRREARENDVPFFDGSGDIAAAIAAAEAALFEVEKP
jgi:2-phosphoglycerate kinase